MEKRKKVRTSSRFYLWSELSSCQVPITSESIFKILHIIYKSCAVLIEDRRHSRAQRESQLPDREYTERLEFRCKGLVEYLSSERFKLKRADNELAQLKTKLAKKEEEIIRLGSHVRRGGGRKKGTVLTILTFLDANFRLTSNQRCTEK